MSIVFDSSTPIYQQIADDIRRRIVNGELNAGDQLMSTTQYATTYRINPATANKAFALLTVDGIVFKQRGIGMFVADDAAAILREQGRQTYVSNRLAPAILEGLALGYGREDIQEFVNAILEEK
ncbi:GntR family transcriptional regulator [Trueperella pyogenes]|uniref:GntR family transcriptional regulator n=1 Tax=Trueperella pyogenes TaxID=1661 RepID=UPI00345C8D33